MTVDPKERVIVLSRETYRTTVTRECSGCSMEIEKGTRVLSLGIIDRMNETKERWYVCSFCAELYSYPMAEDAPEHVQEFMLENRLTEEIWKL